ncbi:MAG TPA: hypothetical protein VKG87_06430 [Terriglobales bacterium]|nr:hypothetical protein [Terriglobales bacterium]
MVRHDIALNGTPVSVRRNVDQLTPELFWKNSDPEPLAGVEKVNVLPTGVQVSLQSGSLTITLGSGTEFANKPAAHDKTNISTSNKRQAFMGPPMAGKYLS